MVECGPSASEVRAPWAGARSDEGVQAARDRYLAEHGLRVEEYDAPRFEVRLRGWKIRLPNPSSRRKAVALHDLHHVATGLPADWSGEMQVSAWEVGAGLGGLWVAWLICFPLFILGLVAQPRSTWRSYRAGRSCRSLFAWGAPLSQLLALEVGELRERLGLPSDGLPRSA